MCIVRLIKQLDSNLAAKFSQRLVSTSVSSQTYNLHMQSSLSVVIGYILKWQLSALLVRKQGWKYFFGKQNSTFCNTGAAHSNSVNKGSIYSNMYQIPQSKVLASVSWELSDSQKSNFSNEYFLLFICSTLTLTIRCDSIVAWLWLVSQGAERPLIGQRRSLSTMFSTRLLSPPLILKGLRVYQNDGFLN